jgi:hypothetical protein
VVKVRYTRKIVESGVKHPFTKKKMNKTKRRLEWPSGKSYF